ncbi:MAG: hypothetical protein LBD63_02765 [Mycoplasmataceae bacterium]|nr:hypothetical protein [Mycoplasmataceae bacterium]
MNFVAIIGIVDQVTKLPESNDAIVNVKVEKTATNSSDDDWYDLVPVSINRETFATEMKQISHGQIVGIKGRINFVQNKLCLIGERIQVF